MNCHVFLAAPSRRKPDVPDFCIVIHGVKGGLANIGAVDLAARAAHLEHASMAGDGETCVRDLPGFSADLALLQIWLQDILRDEG